MLNHLMQYILQDSLEKHDVRAWVEIYVAEDSDRHQPVVHTIM